MPYRCLYQYCDEGLPYLHPVSQQMNTVDMNVCPVNSPILSLKNPATHSKGLDLLGATQLPSLQNHPKQVDQIIMAKQAGGPKGGEGQRDDD